MFLGRSRISQTFILFEVRGRTEHFELRTSDHQTRMQFSNPVSVVLVEVNNEKYQDLSPGLIWKQDSVKEHERNCE